MPIAAVLGAQWGDEGKGKIATALARRLDALGAARFGGGPNARHSLLFGNETLEFRLLPAAGSVTEFALVGNSVVIDLDVLYRDALHLRSINPSARLFVSDRCHIITPLHREEDSSEHSRTLGTTGAGVGPCVADRVRRKGLRIQDAIAGNGDQDVSSLLGPVLELVEVVDTSQMIADLLRTGRWLIAEGAQGSALDIEHGDYPFVTSSYTNIGGVLNGLGVSHKDVGVVFLAATAYLTKLGAGPFPTRASTTDEALLQRLGAEFDALRGEFRACGWLDVAHLRRAGRLNGADALVLSKVDVLAQLEEVQIHDTDAGTVTRFSSWPPLTCDEGPLPEELVSFLRHVEVHCSVPIAAISYGPGSEHFRVIRPEAVRASAWSSVT